MQKRIEQVDALTGEIMEGATLAVIFPKRKNGFQQGGWVAMAQHPMIELAKMNLGAQAMRVLLFVLGKLDFENWINVNQSAAAADLGMSRQNFGRALRELVTVEAVLVGPKVGPNCTYRLNPAFGWKGSAKGHHEALRDRMAAARVSVVKS